MVGRKQGEGIVLQSKDPAVAQPHTSSIHKLARSFLGRRISHTYYVGNDYIEY